MSEERGEANGAPAEDAPTGDADSRLAEQHRPIPDGGSESIQGGEPPPGSHRDKP